MHERYIFYLWTRWFLLISISKLRLFFLINRLIKYNEKQISKIYFNSIYAFCFLIQLVFVTMLYILEQKGLGIVKRVVYSDGGIRSFVRLSVRPRLCICNSSWTTWWNFMKCWKNLIMCSYTFNFFKYFHRTDFRGFPWHNMDLAIHTNMYVTRGYTSCIRNSSLTTRRNFVKLLHNFIHISI